MKELRKGDIVFYRNTKAKIIGVSIKGGKTCYKLRLNDTFNTIVYNVDSKEITK